MSKKPEISNQHSNSIKVLLIEDNPGDVGLIRGMLAEVRDDQLDLEYVERLSTGLERLSEGGIDVLLLDLTLPDCRGFETFTKVFAQAPEVPIVVLTGLNDETLAIKAVHEGAQDYLFKKQVDSNLLVRSIRYAIERKRSEEKLKQSFETIRKTLDGIVQAMAVVVEARDPYTAGHQRRVAGLAYAIAKEMGFSEKEIEGIRVACLLHDIGKITIPIEILSKPGSLTEVEFRFIKKHPQVGYDILKGIEFPWQIGKIVLQHHERLDGSGYPSGLSRENILPEAKILSVADVVEAMSSHRPYRPARGIDKALGEVLEKRGVLYEPEVVNNCVKLFAEKSFAFQ
ncbi:MAG: HD domain-containing protein [Candidatus Cloacimonadota bacterium]|nr:MAG: HD domain-containing protein [Candidatus Cloacimonadota bacterium]